MRTYFMIQCCILNKHFVAKWFSSNVTTKSWIDHLTTENDQPTPLDIISILHRMLGFGPIVGPRKGLSNGMQVLIRFPAIFVDYVEH
jgi:hypothetical protein